MKKFLKKSLDKNTIKIIIIIIFILILIIILINIIKYFQEQKYINKVLNTEYAEYEDFKTAKEYIIYSGNTYIKEVESSENDFYKDIYMKFKYDLYTNVGENYISQGFKYQKSFEKNYFPTFRYNVQGVEISKTICMERGKEVVGVYYRIKNANKYSKLTIAPIVNFRDFHTMSTDHFFDVKQIINGT